MTAWDDKDREGKMLWDRSRQAFLREDRETDAMVDPLVLAAYLESRLPERESAALEAALAGSETDLDLLLASRAALAAAPEAGAPEAVSDRVLRRAQLLTGFQLAPDKQGFFAWLFGGSPLRPLAAAGAFGAYLLVCVASFDLGQGEGLALAGRDDGIVVADLDEDLVLAGLDDGFITADLDDEPADGPLWDLGIEDVL